MADFTGIPYGEIALAAAAPAILYYVCVYVAVSLEAQRAGLKPDTSLVLPRFLEVIRRDWLYLIPLVTIAWGVVALNRPSYAGALACAALIPVLLFRIRPWRETPIRLTNGLIDGMQRMVVVGVACAVAGLVVGTLSMTDLSGKISSGLFTLASGSYALTVFTAILVIIVLGMGMPVPAVYALSAVLAAPALIALNIPTMSAHLLIVYYAAVSAITPPVAVASFAAASLASANPLAISLLACRIAAVAFVIPVIFIGRPELLLMGEPIHVISTLSFVTLGCLAMTMASEAWFKGPIGPIERIGLGLTSIALFADRFDLNAGASIALVLWVIWRIRAAARNP
jgi:TRAP transporter 4TM/12TM fusion protein